MTTYFRTGPYSLPISASQPFSVSAFPAASLRALRDKIYGPCTDNNWDNCKEHWQKPDQTKWLIEKAAKLSEHQPS